MNFNELIIDKIDSLSIDDILRSLIKDSDLEEVACCLDMIAKENMKEINMFENGVRIYPL